MSEDQYEQEFECSFTAAIVGSYYGKLINEADKQGRITKVPYQRGVEVTTIWDLGGDGMPVWFFQMVGREPRLIDYYEEVGGTLEHAVREVKSRDYNYGSHVFPHDGAHDSIRTGITMKEQATQLGLRNIITMPREDIDDGIELVKQLIPRLLFDKEKCEQGLEALKNYQRRWDEERKVYAKKPLHNWASHAADALRYLAMWLKIDEGRVKTKLQPYGQSAKSLQAF